MPVEPGSARTRSSSRTPREAPVEVVRQVWAVVASAGQVHSCRVAAEARSLMRSNAHRCIRATSTEEGGRRRTARHELLKMVMNTDDTAALVRACFELPCTLRGNSSPRRTANTCAAGANATDRLPDVVVSAGEALRSGIAVGEVVSPSWPRGCTAGAADPPPYCDCGYRHGWCCCPGGICCGCPFAGCDLDHRRGACLAVCLAGHAHGLHLQPRFGRCPHGQRLARGLRHSSSLGPSGNSPLEQAHSLGL